MKYHSNSFMNISSKSTITAASAIGHSSSNIKLNQSSRSALHQGRISALQMQVQGDSCANGGHVFGSSSLTDFQVTFQANGLPSGNTWFVILANGTSYNSTTDVIGFQEANGTYNYTIISGNSSWEPATYTGSFTVAGAPVNVSTSFSLVTHQVLFVALELPNGVGWRVTLGTQSVYSTSDIAFEEPNGTYKYSIGIVPGYRIFSGSSSGLVRVDGYNTSVAVYYTSVTYQVNITESGLPSGTLWFADLNGIKFSTNTATLTYTEPNGTYSLTILNTTSYYATHYIGMITVNGSYTSQSVYFAAFSYVAGTVHPSNATVAINNESVPTINGQYNASEPAGYYKVVVSAAGYRSYYDNLTLSTGQVTNLTITLQAIGRSSKPQQLTFPLTDIILPIVIAASIAATHAALATWRKRKNKL